MDDAKIVQLYWDRSEWAIPATADKYGSYCTSIAKNILGNREDAEECVNDTYMNAWSSMPPHRPNVLSTFLGKIVRNLSIKRYKHNTADKRGGGQATVVLDEIAEFVSDTDSVEKLAELRGGKLSKKKNLISQFKRLYPDYQVVSYTPEQMPSCRELCRQWTSHHKQNETILEEEDALSRSFESSGALGLEGVCLYAGGKLAAFSFWTRLDSRTCDEHYEKADPSFKGGAQMVNQAGMCLMREKYEFVNREQDLGIEGLRQSKLSYVPDQILRNWNLHPLEGAAG